MASKKPVEEIECGMFYGKPLLFRPNSHRYIFDGKPIPSVTTILGHMNKPLLLDWAAKMAVEKAEQIATENAFDPGKLMISKQQLANCWSAYHEKRDEGADVGKYIHQYAEAVMKGERPELPTTDAERNGIDGLNSFFLVHKVEPIRLEKRIVSQKHHYAGTTDFYGWIDGECVVLDFKSGKAIYNEAWFQTEGYRLAMQEEGLNDQITAKWIVRLDKITGQFEAVRRPISEVDCAPFLALVAFDAALRVWKEANSVKAKKKGED